MGKKTSDCLAWNPVLDDNSLPFKTDAAGDTALIGRARLGRRYVTTGVVHNVFSINATSLSSVTGAQKSDSNSPFGCPCPSRRQLDTRLREPAWRSGDQENQEFFAQELQPALSAAWGGGLAE